MAFFLSLKHNFIAYRSSKVPYCVFEIHQLCQSGFSRVYSNCCGSCSFEPEIIKTSQSSHKIYSNNILNFQEFTTILNTCTKKVWKLIECTIYQHFCVPRVFLLPASQHLPPCQNSLWLHATKANYRAAIWRQYHHININVPSPTNHGWKCEDQRLVVQWSSFPATPSTF